MKIYFYLFLFLPASVWAQENVGVGTVNPVAKLDIRSIGTNPSIPGTSSTGVVRIGVAANEGIDIGKAGISPYSGWIQSGYNGNVTDPLSLQPLGGHVGIGVLGPNAKLHISHNSTTSSAQLRLTETSANDFARIKFETESDPGIFWDLAASSDSTASNSRLNFFYNNPGFTGDKMTILGNGNVGIGTTSPLNRLQINGDASSTNTVFRALTSYSGNSNIIGVEGVAMPATGYGIGGTFTGGWRGLRAYAQGNSSTDLCIAVEASAYGTSGTRTGLFGRAIGGSTNWAGYFAEGNVYVTNDLRIGSGAQGGATGYKVAVDGKLIAEEVRVQLSQNWPDYVFEESYPLPELKEVAAFIQREKHLPGIPSASELEQNGLHLGEMQRSMMEKIEELMLYILQQDKRIDELEKALLGQ